MEKNDAHNPNVGEKGALTSLSMDPEGQWLLSSGEDGHIRRWSLKEGVNLADLETSGAVNALALHPDGDLFASGGKDGKIIIWSIKQGIEVESDPEQHSEPIAFPNGLAFSRNGDYLAIASYDGMPHIWDRGKKKFFNLGRSNRVQVVAFSPDGDFLATSGNDGNVILWDTKNYEQIVPSLIGHGNTVFDLAFINNGRQLLSASRDNTLRLWDIASGVTQRVFQGHMADVWGIAVYEDRFYTASGDATVRSWSTNTPEQWLWDTKSNPQAVAISPNAKFIALGMNNGTLSLRELPKGESFVDQENAHSSEGIKRIAFNDDGSLLELLR